MKSCLLVSLLAFSLGAGAADTGPPPVRLEVYDTGMVDADGTRLDIAGLVQILHSARADGAVVWVSGARADSTGGTEFNEVMRMIRTSGAEVRYGDPEPAVK